MNKETVLALIDTLESQVRLLKVVCSGQRDLNIEVKSEPESMTATEKMLKEANINQAIANAFKRPLPPKLLDGSERKTPNRHYSIPQIYEYMIAHSDKYGRIPKAKHVAEAFNISVGLYYIVKDRLVEQGKLRSVGRGDVRLPYINSESND